MRLGWGSSACAQLFDSFDFIEANSLSFHDVLFFSNWVVFNGHLSGGGVVRLRLRSRIQPSTLC